MNHCTGKEYSEKAAKVLEKMKDTQIKCDLGMNLEIFNKQQPDNRDKQWKTQKNCSFSLFELAIGGAVLLTAMLIGCCLDAKNKHGKNCRCDKNC